MFIMTMLNVPQNLQKKTHTAIMEKHTYAFINYHGFMTSE